jgi:rhodanese-related sulfurtransferase
MTPTALRRSLLTVLAVPALALALAACGGDDEASSPSTAPESATVVVLEPVEAQELIEATPDEVVLDVRTPEEFAAGHVPDATNVDVEAADFADRLEALDPEATYVVYCQSGRRSAIAADKMVEAGFTTVYDMGGITDWQAAGLPVES